MSAVMGKSVNAAVPLCSRMKIPCVVVTFGIVTAVFVVYTQLSLVSLVKPLRKIGQNQWWTAHLSADTTTPPQLLNLTQQGVPEVVPWGNSNLPYSTSIVREMQGPPPDIFTEHSRSFDGDSNLKKILFWNDDVTNKHFGFGFGREPFLLARCRVNTCTTTGNRTRYPIEEVDAVFWHLRSRDKSFPKTRSPHTRYVFWMMESPMNMQGDLRLYQNVFNWTFTYRLDSDIPQPYNQVFRRPKPLPLTPRNYAEGKTKLAAWFVSHCTTPSGRETLVKNLQKRINVDVYGRCGPLKCPRKTTKRCYDMLSTTYKFYLSFENSLCRDYITEKFFSILSLDVVPVVFGLGNYSLQAPPHSYIDALSFPSVSALADYLLYLDHNDTAYNEYFMWKRFHQLFDWWTWLSQQYCALCELLHSDAPAKVYDMHKWYTEGGHCKTTANPDIKRFVSDLPPPAN